MDARVQQARARLDRLVGQREAAHKRVKSLEASILQGEHRIDVQLKVVALLQQLLDVLIRDKAKEVAALLTDGCRSIFSDMTLSVEEVVGVKHGKVSVTFETVEEKGDGLTIRGDVVESYGGGVAAVQGMLLRLYVVLGKGMRMLLVADEPLATVSAQYVSAVGSFLQRVCESSGLDLFMVTHQHGFLEYSHRSYEAVRKGDVTVIRRLDEE